MAEVPQGNQKDNVKPNRDPDSAAAVAPEGPLGVRTGSEAAVESGLQPVFNGPTGLAGATEVKNKDLRERDEKELRRRGVIRDRGRGGPRNPVTVSFAGLMMVSVDGEEEDAPRSGSFTGEFSESLTIRALTNEELEKYSPSGQRLARRADDLAKGSGAGGGGNPMKAGEAQGSTSGAQGPSMGRATTSAGNPNVGTGGTHSRNRG